MGVDNIQVTRLLCTHLLALGHRRIAFVSGPIRTVSRLERLKGYRSTLHDANVKIEPEFIWEGVGRNFGDSTAIELGRQGAHDLLTLPKPPTAFVAINYHFAFGIYMGARDLGLKIPEDISITGIDDTLLSEIIEPSLTTIQQPLNEIARLAVERLVGRLKGSYTGKPDHQSLSPGLIVRASTAHCRSDG
ncbi:MAG: substrate-binding domain-containing protein [Deltaproteobacteria bacterium]|nr:substrate-binding domain-containing protein [Deltaproteobacteria bacterium]